MDALAPRAAPTTTPVVRAPTGPRVRVARAMPDVSSFHQDDARLSETKRILATEYERYGMAGVLGLLPAGVVRGMRRRSSFSLSSMFADPEKIIFLLLAAFAVVVLYESFSRTSVAGGVGDSLMTYMPPFPVSTP